MNRFWNSPWMYRLLALLLTIALFAYVNVQNINNTRPSGTQDTTILATKKQTVSVPLQINANTDKYFITGYPQKVKVTLDGNASLVTVSANTQSFRIIADLTKLGIGRHTVQLREEGLNKELTYTIDPRTIDVEIQTRDNKKMPIQVDFNKDSLAPGYTTEAPKLSTSTVDVTGARSEIERISQVVAKVALNRNTKTDVDQEVLLQALDSDGNTVNAVISPQTVHVTLPVVLPSKKVDLELEQKGSGVSGHRYSLSSETKRITVYGSNAELAKIKKVTLPVDVTGVSATVTKNIDVPAPSGLVGVDPKTIAVKIDVTGTTNATPSSTDGASHSSDNSSSSSSANSSSSSSESASSDNESSSSSSSN